MTKTARSRSNCSCTAQQLNLVGCDCTATYDAVTVRVWLKGYASDDVGVLHCDGGLDVDAEVAAAFGYTARAFETRPVYQMPLPPVDAAVARYYTQGDNT